MTYRLKILDMQRFDPAHKDYGVILAEKHPKVEFRLSNVNQTVDTFLWYPYELGKHPPDFVGYHREKLGITDPAEALHLISQWNQDIKDDTLIKVTFSRIFKITGIKFGEIDIQNPNGSIVMRVGGVGYSCQKTIRAGRGGNVWQYLQPGIKPTHEELQAKFNLNKTQRDKFIKKW